MFFFFFSFYLVIASLRQNPYKSSVHHLSQYNCSGYLIGIGWLDKVVWIDNSILVNGEYY